MNTVWRQALIFLALTAGISPAAAVPTDPPVRRFVAEDVTSEGEKPDAACLVMAVALAFDADHIYVADAQDCAIKVFTKSGKFESAIGRKGQGPGEFSFPSGISVLGGRLFVADKFNRRVQILDVSGRYIRSFAVPFAPDKVFVLSADKVLVTHNPGGRSGPDNLLHVFNGTGALLREELAARLSGDPVFDAFSNMIIVNPGPQGDFFVIFKSQERSILHYSGDAGLIGRIPVDARYGFKSISLPVKGPRKTLEAFCWESAYDRGRFYLLAPEYTEDNDLGPGDKIFVLDGSGRLEARIELPARVSRLAVDGDRIYAPGGAGELRIFRISR